MSAVVITIVIVIKTTKFRYADSGVFAKNKQLTASFQLNTI